MCECAATDEANELFLRAKAAQLFQSARCLRRFSRRSSAVCLYRGSRGQATARRLICQLARARKRIKVRTHMCLEERFETDIYVCECEDGLL